jgi:transcriptional regulator with GAF, ATPase, and Fis domain
MSTSEDFPTLSSASDPNEIFARGGAPRLVILLDCESPMQPSEVITLTGVAAVEFGRGTTRSVSSDSAVRDVRLADRFMSTRHARLTVRGQQFRLEDLGSKNGTIVNGRKQAIHNLAYGDIIELGHTVLMFDDNPATAVNEDPNQVFGFATFSAEFAERLDKLKSIAPSPVSVLVHGETGTGKEVMARSIHQLSGVPGEFVAVNCGALPAGLLESELFGYRKGAFSGAAKDHAGLVRAADEGTLFLDEIGDLPLSAQAALLRVLQEREVLPIGEVRPIKVRFRLVSATHRDLEALVAVGDFRQDLYARMSGFVLDLPPLRRRRVDIGLLVRAMLRHMGGEAATTTRFATDAVLALCRHDWPLNMRELEKCLEAAVVLAGSGPVRASHLPDSVQRSITVERAAATSSPSPPSVPGDTKKDREPPKLAGGPMSAQDEVRKVELEALLKEHGGNITAVAMAMGKARVQIRRWIKRYGLSRDE